MDFMTDTAPNQPNNNRSLLTNIVGFSFLASLLQGFLTGRPATGGSADTSYLAQTVQLFFLGTLIEGGRRFYEWLKQRFQFQYSITAQFTEGDPTYEWIIHFLTEHQVWKRSRDFRVSATNSARKWTVSIQSSGNDSIPLSSISTNDAKATSSDPSAPPKAPASAEYVPTYEAPQLFRWNGYWVEIKRSKGMPTFQPGVGTQAFATLYITIYTRDMSVLPTLIDTAKSLYLSSSRPHVTVHSSTQNTMPQFSWNNTKRKPRRPLDSIILPEGRMQELISDAREFMNLEGWYIKAGIPHRRGYLLYGPPGTGKTSTIYGLAGELGLEIYTVSLASSMVDDFFLQRAADSIPKHSIFLIEDIDCAFPAPRSDDDDDEDDSSAQSAMMMGYPMMGRRGRYGMMAGMGRSAVTLSGLLNVLDGVGSEEGKLFFATTNHVDHLDAALLRPGRIDVKIPYKLATQDQAAALFMRFYPETHTEIPEEALAEFTEKILSSPPAYTTSADPEKTEKQQAGEEKASLKSQYLTHLSQLFASQIPADEFSTAELQGFLLGCKSQSQSQTLSMLSPSLPLSQSRPSTSHPTAPNSSITPLTSPSPPFLTLLKAPAWVHSERTYKLEKAAREEAKKEKRRLKKEKAEEEKVRGGLVRLMGGMAGGPGGQGGPVAGGGMASPVGGGMVSPGQGGFVGGPAGGPAPVGAGTPASVVNGVYGGSTPASASQSDVQPSKPDGVNGISVGAGPEEKEKPNGSSGTAGTATP
ncbi:hypothetical protein BJ165DRAFT_1515242 [Panaeolus papilionaceus]|nr:hypothetical protein BJ165DRAFT_1515242 [Panaeolus papilionaceus]